MKLSAPFAIAFILSASQANAQLHGVAVQVNEGKRVPTVAQLRIVLRSGDFVRDVLGWQHVDRTCNLRNNPSQPIVIPASMVTLYQNVAAAQGRNFVTLAFNNRFCGQPGTSGAKYFPNTDPLRAEFAAYAVRVVKQVPALGGISIWNELNGTWDGGYTTRADKLSNYCRLANEVIVAVRQVNPTVPIALGASVGWNVGTWFTDMFDVYGCIGKGDPTIWLDVHPYLSGKVDGATGKEDWQLWNDNIAQIRARGISNPLVATEWGAKASYLWLSANPGGNYMTTFNALVVARDPAWAGLMWYEMLYDRRMPNAGLFDESGANLTNVGTQYVGAFNP